MGIALPSQLLAYYRGNDVAELSVGSGNDTFHMAVSS